MRELKFRAWNKEQKRMGYLCLSEGSQGFGDPGWLDESPLMQYTGLKDKNGVEIYEGDILKLIGRRHDGTPYEHIYDVTWGICGYSDRGIGWQLDPDEVKEHEIIGNIHENPELLKETT